jgi:carbamoyltransferase
LTKILGISAYYHDSAAALVIDGAVVAAAQEERFTRKKHDHNFPINAVRYCLKEAKLESAKQIDYVVFYDKPLVKFDRLLESYLAYAPLGIRSFIKAMPLWLKKKLWMKEDIEEQLDFEGDVLFAEHHESHAASAFFPSPFESAAIVTMDGVGEWATSSIGLGDKNKLKLLKELHFPHSIGLLYSAFTYFTGFKVNSGEYKLMGLAPYGVPKYVDAILNEIIDIKDDGSFKLNMSYFDYCAGLRMTSSKFDRIFDGPARAPESKLTQREMDIAASIQVVTEKVMINMARYANKVTGSKNLVLAGGVALNCVGNGKLLKEGTFENIWIQPAAGDAGGALGAALFLHHQLLGGERKVDNAHDMQHASKLGPRFEETEIDRFIREKGISASHYDTWEQLADKVAELMAKEQVIGWFQGRMEFGPRALGSRSIIGDARSPEMQTRMNVKIKFRESFRPFAPSVLRERVSEYFDLDCDSPYMLLVADVQKHRRKETEKNGAFGIEKLKQLRSDVPAITHVDYSARIQTVRETEDPVYYALLKKFHEKTGCAVIVNTSFNVRGEPIVCTPEDAYRCFARTNMDCLVLEKYVIEKKDQTNLPPIDDSWQKEFALD